MSDPWKFSVGPATLSPTAQRAIDAAVELIQTGSTVLHTEVPKGALNIDGEWRDATPIPPVLPGLVVHPLGWGTEHPPVLALTGLEAPARQRPMQKLGRTMMRSFAARLLKTKQDGLCPLCKKEIDLTIKGEGVLDHDHDSGEIRGVLHRSCNAAEGKISNAAARWGAKSASYSAIILYLQNMVDYLRAPGAGMLYPMHKTPDEKRDDRNAKARAQRAATKAKLALRGRKKEA